MTSIDSFLRSENALYHYTKLRTGIEYILKNRHLKFSKMSNFNDVLEKVMQLPGFIPTENAQKDFKYLKRLIDEAGTMAEQVGILCFCSNYQKIEGVSASQQSKLSDSGDIGNPFLNLVGYQKNRMWEQYGDNFQGICFVFDNRELEHEVNIRKYRFNKADNVTYSKYPFLGIYNIVLKNLSGNKQNSQEKAEEIEKYIKQKFFIKHYDYKEENEYRVIVHLDNKKDDLISIESSLKAVIISSVFPEVYIEMIKAIIKNWNSDIKLIKYNIGSINILEEI